MPVPKLSVSQKLASAPRMAPPASDAPPEYVDRTKITFADGSEVTWNFDSLKLGDVLEEIDMENVRIQNAERERGRPF